MKKRPKAKPDPDQRAAALVRTLTGEPLPNGEDLLGSPELRKQLRELPVNRSASPPPRETFG